MKQGGIGNPFDYLVTAIVLIMTVWIVFVMVTEFAKNDPNFGTYGYPILGAIAISVIAYFRNGKH